MPSLQRASYDSNHGWGCPACHRPITPPLASAECIKTTEPHYWRILYTCACGTRYAVAVTIDFSEVDPQRTATMPLRLISPPSAPTEDLDP